MELQEVVWCVENRTAAVSQLGRAGSLRESALTCGVRLFVGVTVGAGETV